MNKFKKLLERAAQRLELPVDAAAGVPHLELNGFCECALDCHTGILEYEKERIVVALNIGTVTIEGEGLELRQMHRERLTIIGNITCLTYGEGGLRGCGG